MKNRIFTHVNGFGDDTKYVVFTPEGKCFFIMNDGTKKEDFHWRLGDAIDSVGRGSWKEVTNELEAKAKESPFFFCKVTLGPGFETVNKDSGLKFSEISQENGVYEILGEDSFLLVSFGKLLHIDARTGILASVSPNHQWHLHRFLKVGKTLKIDLV